MGRNMKKRKRQPKRAKLVVGWDEDERKEYLTGFRKRKAERRNRAIEEMVEKERQERLGKRQDRREAEQDKKNARERVIEQVESVFDNVSRRVPKDDRVMKGEGGAAVKKTQKMQKKRAAPVLAREAITYEDDFSRQNFGADNVTVTTTFGFNDDDSNESSDSDSDCGGGGGGSGGSGGESDEDDGAGGAPQSYKERYVARKKARKEKNIKLEQERLEKAHKARVARKKIVIAKGKKPGSRSGAAGKRQKSKGQKTKKGRRR